MHNVATILFHAWIVRVSLPGSFHRTEQPLNGHHRPLTNLVGGSLSERLNEMRISEVGEHGASVPLHLARGDEKCHGPEDHFEYTRDPRGLVVVFPIAVVA